MPDEVAKGEHEAGVDAEHGVLAPLMMLPVMESLTLRLKLARKVCSQCSHRRGIACMWSYWRKTPRWRWKLVRTCAGTSGSSGRMTHVGEAENS